MASGKGRRRCRSPDRAGRCTYLPYAEEDITFTSSRRRVISLIASMRDYCGEAFPDANGERIPNVFIVIDGEP
jgi:hypothetical protein